MWIAWICGGLFGLAVLAGVAFVVFIIRLVNSTVAETVRKMENPDGLLTLIDNGPRILEEGLEYHERSNWAKAHGFAPDIVADFAGAAGGQIITIGVWRNRATRTYLSSYTTPQKVCSEFVTQLEKDSALTTSNTMDSMTMPSAPGRYLQSFDGASLDELLRRHEEALAWLWQHKCISPVDRPESTDVVILDSVRRQMAYIKTLPLWRHRGFWWYFVRRGRMNNRSIAERFAS